MGGCASRPKDADLNQQAPEKVDTNSIPHPQPQPNDNNGAETAAPLVDLSEVEPKQEAETEAEAPVVADLTAELTEPKVEAIAKDNITQASDQQPQPQPDKEVQPKSDATPTPTTEERSAALPVAV